MITLYKSHYIKLDMARIVEERGPAIIGKNGRLHQVNIVANRRIKSGTRKRYIKKGNC